MSGSRCLDTPPPHGGRADVPIFLSLNLDQNRREIMTSDFLYFVVFLGATGPLSLHPTAPWRRHHTGVTGLPRCALACRDSWYHRWVGGYPGVVGLSHTHPFNSEATGHCVGLLLGCGAAHQVQLQLAVLALPFGFKFSYF